MADRDARRDRERRLTPLEGTPEDQEVPGWTGRIMIWLRVAAHLVAIQLLMIAGTLLGLVVAGLGPALTAGSSLLRRIVDGEPSDALWRDYWREYRAELPRAALVTAPFLLVAALTGYEALLLLAHGDDALAAVLTGVVLAVGLYAVAALIYAPHVLRRYRDPAARALRFVVLAPLLSPFTALGGLVTAIAVTVAGARFLPVLILAGLSVPLLLTGILVDRWLDKVDARAEG